MPTSDITADLIIGLIYKHDILSSDEPISAKSDLFTLGLDSLAMMQLLIHLEQRFKLAIPPAEISHERFSNPQKLADWLQEFCD
jgi:acyl carrier protein